MYIINAKHCISPTRSVVYHQAAGKSSPKGADEIQGRGVALDDIHDCVVMICQACGLDKKIRQVETCRIFWQGQKDSNPQGRFWRPECYHYIMPLDNFAKLQFLVKNVCNFERFYIIINTNDIVKQKTQN